MIPNASLSSQEAHGVFSLLRTGYNASSSVAHASSNRLLATKSNDSADADAEYLSDGIAESLINNLSQISTLRVMARSTVFRRYKGKTPIPKRPGAICAFDMR